jgi:hypothetical protein
MATVLLNMSSNVLQNKNFTLCIGKIIFSEFKQGTFLCNGMN